MPTPARPPSSRRKISVRLSPVHGKGVFANRAIATDELICEYTGERIAWMLVTMSTSARDSGVPPITI
jgi:hypothetical protein